MQYRTNIQNEYNRRIRWNVANATLYKRGRVRQHYRTLSYGRSTPIAVVVVVVIFFQYNESIDIVDELVLNRNSMVHDW